MTEKSWLIEGAVPDRETITAEWKPADQRLIEGVVVREVLNVPKPAGRLTEIFRRDWFSSEEPVDQVFVNVLEPRSISGWHAHAFAKDRLFAISGLFTIALFDAREESATRGVLNVFRFGEVRPALVIVPPRVWHGVQNISSAPAMLLNLTDIAYDYTNPDHWRIPHDSPAVPFDWA